MRLPALALSLMATASPSSALTGAQLLDECNHGSDILCAAYIVGIYDGLKLGVSRTFDTINFDYSAPITSAEFQSVTLMACLPDTVRSERLEGAVMDFLTIHAESLGVPASILIGDALSEAFPCQGADVHPITIPRFPKN